MRHWLKNLREEKKLSKTEVARLLGITRQYYGYIETGERLPDLFFSIAVKISEIFNISLDEIKKLEEKEPQHEHQHGRN